MIYVRTRARLTLKPYTFGYLQFVRGDGFLPNDMQLPAVFSAPATSHCCLPHWYCGKDSGHIEQVLRKFAPDEIMHVSGDRNGSHR
jgi:hypothetical protein